jgi:hypothetical protein
MKSEEHHVIARRAFFPTKQSPSLEQRTEGWTEDFPAFSENLRDDSGNVIVRRVFFPWN